MKRFLALIVASACGSANVGTHPEMTSPSATRANIDEDAVADLFEHHRNHHHGGLTAFVAMSLDSLGSTPEQRVQLDPIQAALFATAGRARDAENAVRDVLIEGASTGAIDRKRVDTAIERLQIAAAGVFEDASAAMNRLHAALSREQRATLADKVEAHWTVWREANPANEANRPRGELAAMESSLALTPEQGRDVRVRFAESMKQVTPLDIENVTSRIQLFERAFVGETFDARSLGQVAVGVELAAWGATRLARLCEAIVAVATPDQHSKLAGVLREHQTRWH